MAAPLKWLGKYYAIFNRNYLTVKFC